MVTFIIIIITMNTHILAGHQHHIGDLVSIRSSVTNVSEDWSLIDEMIAHKIYVAK